MAPKTADSSIGTTYIIPGPVAMCVPPATNPGGCPPSQPHVRSYIDGLMTRSGVQAPRVSVSPTAPWTRVGDGLGSQLPKPVKTAAKNDEDVLMQEAEDPGAHMDIQKSSDESTSKKPDDAEWRGLESKTAAVSSKVVIAQASPLKRISMPTEDKAEVNSPDILSKQCPLSEVPSEARKWAAEWDQRQEGLSCWLKWHPSAGKPVAPCPVLPKTPAAKTSNASMRASVPPLNHAVAVLEK